jgi:NAD(P)-dependent dehydrogenase (short-subunit alcohol dehydrogenase family)
VWYEKNKALIHGAVGLAVAEALQARQGWDIHLLDMNQETGNEAAKRLQATFHKVDVTDYSTLSNTFRDIFKATRRLDFCFANAGILERSSFYRAHETGDEPPDRPDTLVMDINATAVIYTSYLAQHYFRQTPNDGSGPRSLIITASCGGLYAVPANPIYGASKFAALGWTRNIAGPFYQNDGIRVNVCMRTSR